jgi:hypothetical protein
MNLPYVGITGIVTDQDVNTVRKCVCALREHTHSHRFMAGVLVSRKTLSHEFTSNRRYPEVHEVKDLLEGCLDAGAWPVVHYNTGAEGVKLLAELEVLYGYCPAMRGLQLNVVTPDPATIEGFCLAHPEIEVILQVNGSSLKTTGLPPLGYVQTYRGIKHALLDASGGNGKGFDPRETSKNIWAMYEPLRLTGVHLGVAGGLGDTSKEALLDLRVLLGHRVTMLGIDLKCLSFDAESGVRSPVLDYYEGEPYQDALDQAKALTYVNLLATLMEK